MKQDCGDRLQEYSVWRRLDDQPSIHGLPWDDWDAFLHNPGFINIIAKGTFARR
jgi:hypothetical protein